MYNDRLLRLAALLETDAANPEGVKFDLSGWGMDAQFSGASCDQRENLIEAGVGFKVGQVVPVNCGTAACAVGLAALTGAFAGEGLTYEINAGGELSPVYEGERSWGAVYEFFGLDADTAIKLFSDNSYKVSRGAEAELAVAARIRELCANGYISMDDED